MCCTSGSLWLLLFGGVVLHLSYMNQSFSDMNTKDKITSNNVKQNEDYCQQGYDIV